ncbi:MAG: tRNA (pseudouridine(54)-N(1))-methyltransferase TrmY, partial [Candidatus Thermoplasmatota archaeon]|nr:tRNA (pseudouridine(54)-N(1))-methyltransferase TrmY [Candidatus Thermoplasmatota archaeon]
MRRFAVIGHRAMARGKLPLNDLAGAGGRFDVLVRATTAALLTSHGLRE